MAESRIAIVTGSNKGIGYAIVEGLCKNFNGKVYLTARNVARGSDAVKKLNSLGYKPSFHQLDVNDEESVCKFQDYIKRTYGGVDVLINNAAIAYNQDSKEPFAEQAEETVKTNYFGLLRMCDAFFPLLKNNGRVVNVSSSAGHLSRIPSMELRAKLSNPSLTVAELNELMLQFILHRKNNVALSNGWNESAYVVSKVGVCALTRIQQHTFDIKEPFKNISVNSVHPGFVDTDMTNHQGILTPDEGAMSTLFLSLENHNCRGMYVWLDARVVDWLAPNIPAPC